MVDRQVKTLPRRGRRQAQDEDEPTRAKTGFFSGGREPRVCRLGILGRRVLDDKPATTYLVHLHLAAKMAPPAPVRHDDPTLIPSDPEDSDFELNDEESSDSDSEDERPSKKPKVEEKVEPT
jgi:hypothetical protein